MNDRSTDNRRTDRPTDRPINRATFAMQKRRKEAISSIGRKAHHKVDLIWIREYREEEKLKKANVTAVKRDQPTTAKQGRHANGSKAQMRVKAATVLSQLCGFVYFYLNVDDDFFKRRPI
eukprot:Selendium_serpulae@DN5064_c2_g1_i1.p1